MVLNLPWALTPPPIPTFAPILTIIHAVHWETLIQAVRRDGLTALIRPGPIREEASAKLLSVNGKFGL